MKKVRVGTGCGFAGDNLDAPRLLAEAGRLDYLTLEYLAELTMSILALQRQRDAQKGFAGDFIEVLTSLTGVLKAQPALKIVTNAGGMNPPACAAKARAVLDAAELQDRRIAVVTGDDLMPDLDRLMAAGNEFTNLDTGEPLSSVRPRVVCANAYLGSRPIAEALQTGAAIVITGRVADAALTVGPLAFEFGWGWNDWDRLCAGTVAGHLLECGAQATGGLWINWQECDLATVGYPIAEVDETGSFTLEKPAGTGGAINIETVTEQLLYEVGDPAAYLSPDVTADFTTPSFAEAARDVVRVSGARGKPATNSYKVSIAYRDGFMASGTLVIFGPDAATKARRCGEIILQRLARAGAAPEHSHIECLGAGELRGGMGPAGSHPPEVVLRVAVRDSRRAIVERFSKEMAPLVTSGPPGVTGYTTGRPQVREVFGYWPALISKDAVRAHVQLVA
jgi:hypothetical protein